MKDLIDETYLKFDELLKISLNNTNKRFRKHTPPSLFNLANTSCDPCIFNPLHV
jgi:hypothetical protein